MDAAGADPGDPAPCAPVSGDVSVCIKCGHVMAYTGELKLREATDADYVGWSLQPGLLERIRRARAAILQLREFRKHADS